MAKQMVVLVTPRVDQGHDIGNAWQEAGAPGVTYIESYGLQRMQEAGSNFQIMPGMMSMLAIMRGNEEHSILLFSIVDDETVVDKLIQATENILGDLSQPHNGIIFCLDVSRTVGIREV